MLKSLVNKLFGKSKSKPKRKSGFKKVPGGYVYTASPESIEAGVKAMRQYGSWTAGCSGVNGNLSPEEYMAKRQEKITAFKKAMRPK